MAGISTGDPTLDGFVKKWLEWDKNEVTRQEIIALAADKNIPELEKRLCSRMEFGTAGLRARMGAGNSMMNDLTIVQTAQISLRGLTTSKNLFRMQHFSLLMENLQGSLDFLMVQFGLCAFKFNKETMSYEARPFNFYVFPRPYTRQAPDRRFLCQSSSIDFLVQQGFDFNKLFYEGIPYLTPKQEDTMREGLNSKHQAFSKFSSPAFVSPDGADMGPGKGPVQIPEEQKDFIEGVCEKIKDFLDSGDVETLQLAPCNGFQRKLIYQTIRTKFSSVHLETKTGEKKERFIVVTRVASDEELKKREKDKQNAEIMELEEAVGFSKVIKLIAESGKMVIGHNMLLDVLHMLNQFCHRVPEDLDEFKSMIQCVFPRILDTKHMANMQPLRDVIPNTSLGNMEQTLTKFPFTSAKVELGEDFRRYDNCTDKYHEAGYDAYVTGCMFATMTNFLGKKMTPVKEIVEPTVELLEPFMNKIYLMRIADIPYLNLTGPDLQPARDHVFHLTFPKEWRSPDINSLFSPFGNVIINWLNDTSAFIALYKRDNAAVVLKTLGGNNKDYQLVPYNLYRAAATPLPPPSAGPPPSSMPPPSSIPPPSAGGVKRTAGVGATEGASATKRVRGTDDPFHWEKGSKSEAVMAQDEIPEFVPRDSDEVAANGAGASEKAAKPFEEPIDW